MPVDVMEVITSVEDTPMPHGALLEARFIPSKNAEMLKLQDLKVFMKI
jgi:hypothetical protein